MCLAFFEDPIRAAMLFPLEDPYVDLLDVECFLKYVADV